MKNVNHCMVDIVMLYHKTKLKVCLFLIYQNCHHLIVCIGELLASLCIDMYLSNMCNTWLDRNSNPGPTAYRADALLSFQASRSTVYRLITIYLYPATYASLNALYIITIFKGKSPLKPRSLKLDMKT